MPKSIPSPAQCKPCPFCGGWVAIHPNPQHRASYYVIYHADACYMLDDADKAPFNFTLLPRNYMVKRWNRRTTH